MLAMIGYLMYGATRFDLRWQMCLCVYLSFVCYLRPCEARSLQGDNLVPPTSAAGLGYQHWGLLLSDQSHGLRGKTGATDESVIVDNDAWLHPLLDMFHRTRRPSAPLWDFRHRDLVQQFTLAAHRLGLDHIKPRLYSLRHGGVSHDLMSRARTVEAAKKRGRWKTDASLRRYAKESRVLSELAKASPDVIAYGAAIEKHLYSIFMTPCRLPAPPEVSATPPRRARPRLLTRVAKRPASALCLQ
jgi:hypothetical protein